MLSDKHGAWSNFSFPQFEGQKLRKFNCRQKCLQYHEDFPTLHENKQDIRFTTFKLRILSHWSFVLVEFMRALASKSFIAQSELADIICVEVIFRSKRAVKQDLEIWNKVYRHPLCGKHCLADILHFNVLWEKGSHPWKSPLFNPCTSDLFTLPGCHWTSVTFSSFFQRQLIQEMPKRIFWRLTIYLFHFSRCPKEDRMTRHMTWHVQGDARVRRRECPQNFWNLSCQRVIWF